MNDAAQDTVQEGGVQEVQNDGGQERRTEVLAVTGAGGASTGFMIGLDASVLAGGYVEGLKGIGVKI